MINKIFTPNFSKALEHTYYAGSTAVPSVFALVQALGGTSDVLKDLAKGERVSNFFLSEKANQIKAFLPTSIQGPKTDVVTEIFASSVFIGGMFASSYVFGKLACKNIAQVYALLRPVVK